MSSDILYLKYNYGCQYSIYQWRSWNKLIFHEITFIEIDFDSKINFIFEDFK